MGEIGLPIAPTRTMASGDLVLLAPELAVVDTHFKRASEQHEARRWEYSLALRCFSGWAQENPNASPLKLLDIGGAGSPFRFMVPGIQIIDPSEVGAESKIEDYQGPPASAVFCISVIEHVPDLEDFCFHLARVTAPGGLLFLTVDIWGRPAGEKDTAHFHDMRFQIFTIETWKALAERFCLNGFTLLGEADWAYHGDQLYGSYSFASLALVKERA